jgi:hypothetical protein
MSFGSGRLEWRTNEGEVKCSVGYEFRQQPLPTLTVIYSAIRQDTKDRQDFRYPIEMTPVPCRFGGLRYWFICPAVKNGVPCRQRVLKLYLPPGAVYFACRCCYELTYRSCQQHDGRLAKLAKNPLAVYALMNSQNPRDQLKACRVALMRDGSL